MIFVYNTIDDFVMTNLAEFNGRQIVSAEASDVDLGAKTDTPTEADAKKEDTPTEALTDADITDLGGWMVAALPERLSSVRSTKRLRDSPAIITEHESAALRRMMRMVYFFSFLNIFFIISNYFSNIQTLFYNTV